MQKIYSLSKAAKLIGTNPKTLKKMIEKKQIKYILCNTRKKISQEHIDEFLKGES